LKRLHWQPDADTRPVGMRVAAYVWAAPLSGLGLALGLSLGLLSGRGQFHIHRQGGVLEIASPGLAACLRCKLPGSGPVAAITLGHVVLGTSAQALDRVRRHERVHVAQAERWGVLFLVAYPLASLWARTRGRHPYRDNVFERAARRIAGF